MNVKELLNDMASELAILNVRIAHKSESETSEYGWRRKRDELLDWMSTNLRKDVMAEVIFAAERKIGSNGVVRLREGSYLNALGFTYR